MRKEAELSPTDRVQIEGITANWEKSGSVIDPQVQLFRERFLRMAFLMDEDEQERCTRLYCEYIAGVIVPQDWQRQDRKWLNDVGLNLNDGRRNPPYNGTAFYQELKKVFPGIFSEEELSWLIENDPTGGGASTLLFDISRSQKSPLPIMVEGSILSWK